MAKGKTSGQNPNAGWFNRFVQTGKSDHETKSNECFGGLCDHCTAVVCIPIAHCPHTICLSHPYMVCFAFSPVTYIILGSLHRVCIATICVCALIVPQDSGWVWSAVHSRATCTRLRASSGCRASEVTLVVWQRHVCTHCTSVR